jgi:hypothetical protein
MKTLRVYLSSTYEDLKEYRAAVFTALEKAGLDVVRMEAYTAADERPVDVCLQDVARSDIYVGLYAWRYGYEPPAEHGNTHGKSITELEYRQAEQRKLRKLLFFAHPDTKAHWPRRFSDEVTGEGERGAKLTTFRSELGAEKTASFFRTPDELATLVLAAIMRSGLSGRPYSVPQRQAGFVPRHGITKALVDSLLGSEGVLGAHVLVQGAGGFGKTALAIDACHRPEVVNAFPDGILWVVLGEKPDLGKQLSNVHVSVTGSPPAVTGVDAIGEALAKAIEGRHCLVVVDDVWRADDLAHFLQLDGQRLLVTTRIRNLIEQGWQTGWLEVPVDEMEAGEATSLLGRGLPLDGAIQETLAGLAERMGCWPLLLDLANARLLEENKSRRGNLAECIGRVVTLFERRGVVGFDRRDSKARNAAVATSIEVGLELAEEMFPGLAEKAAEIAIFPEDLDIPVHVLAELWATDRFVVEEDVLRPLDNLSIVRWHRESDIVRLHDMIRGALKARLADPVAAHRKLLAAYRKHTHGSWADRKDDGYIFDHLSWHLEKGELPDELGSLINRRWLETQAARSGSHRPFCEDALRLLRLARRRSPHDVVQVARCALALSTLGQLTTDAPLELISLYARVAGSVAAGYIATCQNEDKRCAAYALLSSVLVERKEFLDAADALGRALDIGDYANLSDGSLTVLRNAINAFVDSGMRDEAATAVRRLFAAHRERIQVREYNKGVSFISLFSRLDMMDVLDYKSAPSKELAGELARAGELDRALQIAEAITPPHLQAEALAEVTFAAAEAGQEARSHEIAERVIQIAKTLSPAALDVIRDAIAPLGRMGLYREILEIAMKVDSREFIREFILSDLAKTLIDAKRFDAASECIASLADSDGKAGRLRDLTNALIAENDNSGADSAARGALKAAETAREHTQSVFVATAYGFAAEALAAVSSFHDALRAVDWMERIAQFWENDDSEPVRAQRHYHWEQKIRNERDGVLANIAKHLVYAGSESQLREVISRVTSAGLARVVECAVKTLIETRGVDAGLSLLSEQGSPSTPAIQALITVKLACTDRFDEALAGWSDFTNNAKPSDLVLLATEFMRAQRIEHATELFQLAIDRRPEQSGLSDEYAYIGGRAERISDRIDAWIANLAGVEASAGKMPRAAIFVKLAQQTDTEKTSALSLAGLGGALILCNETAVAQQLLRASLTGTNNISDRELGKEIVSLYEQALAATTPAQIRPKSTAPKHEEWYASSAEELRLAIDRGELDTALELAQSENPNPISGLLSELAARFLIAGRDDDALEVTHLVSDFGDGLRIWLDALVTANRLSSALETLQSYSSDIALPALDQLIAAASEAPDADILMDGVRFALRVSALPTRAGSFARAFDRTGSVEGLKLMLDHSESLGAEGLIETARCLLSRGDQSGLEMLPAVIEQLREKSHSIPQCEDEYKKAPWGQKQESDAIVADMFALADFLFECGQHEECRDLTHFIVSLVGKRNMATELTKASVLLRQGDSLETASEMFASALDHSWPNGRKATLETLRAGVRVYMADQRARLRQICEAIRDVESWW